MRYASVCSGVEAASLAWEYLGWEPVFFSEIEPFPCAVLKERFPNVPNLGDMTKITQKGDVITNGTDDIQLHGRGVDLLVGGTPCQGFSSAGRQGGLNDDRSVLALTYIRLLDELRPRWFVWENVPGVFSTNGGGDIKRFIHEITELGYCCAWRVLDAQYVRVDGFPRAVPQRRRRVFVVGHIGGDWKYPAEVLFEREGLLGINPPRRIKAKGIAGIAEGGACSAGRSICYSNNSFGGYARTDVGCTLKASGGDLMGGENIVCEYKPGVPGVFWNGDEVCSCITEEFSDARMPDKGKLPCVICVKDQGGSVINQEGEDVCGTLRSQTKGHEPLVVCFENHPNDSRVCDIGDVCQTLNARCGTGGGNLPLVCTENVVCIPINSMVFGKDKYKEGDRQCFGIGKDGDPTSFTLLANHHHTIAIAENTIGRLPENGGNGNGFSEELAYTQNATGVMGVVQNMCVRHITPVETERLMGFPDNWTRIPWKGKPEEECPDGHRYKACGNSMCVNVMRWIGMRIELVERKTRNA